MWKTYIYAKHYALPSDTSCFLFFSQHHCSCFAGLEMLTHGPVFHPLARKCIIVHCGGTSVFFFLTGKCKNNCQPVVPKPGGSAKIQECRDWRKDVLILCKAHRLADFVLDKIISQIFTESKENSISNIWEKLRLVHSLMWRWGKDFLRSHNSILSIKSHQHLTEKKAKEKETKGGDGIKSGDPFSKL